MKAEIGRLFNPLDSVKKVIESRADDDNLDEVLQKGGRRRLKDVKCPCRCFCCRRKKHRRTVQRFSLRVQFFTCLSLLFISKLFLTIARSILDGYSDRIGTYWYKENTEWMWFWTVGVTLELPANAAAAAMMCIALGCADWTVYIIHTIGLMGGAGEFVLMWSENVSHTGIATMYFSVMLSCFCCLLPLLRLPPAREVFTMIFGPREKSSTEWDAAQPGIFLMVVYHGISIFSYGLIASMPCDPQNDVHCAMPHPVNANVIFHFFIASAVCCLSCALRCSKMVWSCSFCTQSSKVHHSGSLYKASYMSKKSVTSTVSTAEG
jgi:hypothetical protein